jgi:hypothetical protein
MQDANEIKRSQQWFWGIVGVVTLSTAILTISFVHFGMVDDPKFFHDAQATTDRRDAALRCEAERLNDVYLVASRQKIGVTKINSDCSFTLHP